ncbi:hypothetical protein GPJ56_001293 [Histomonas meleagridis]|uniref:uncharacterized protein n=1 Tax=Histomonas meleagridis TaxID=135588 RepID=UPI003559C2BC|nr:hypothetical protein GPJ56_001293 [Histomonas meleagridis]KAH0805050.1 hypothetical protein GO595_001995 [Histomonas meleagridis]
MVKFFKVVFIKLYPGCFRVLQYLSEFLSRFEFPPKTHLFQIFGNCIFGETIFNQNHHEAEQVFLIILEKNKEIFGGSVLGHTSFLTDRQIETLKRKIIKEEIQSNSKRKHSFDITDTTEILNFGKPSWNMATIGSRRSSTPIDDLFFGSSTSSSSISEDEVHTTRPIPLPKSSSSAQYTNLRKYKRKSITATSSLTGMRTLKQSSDIKTSSVSSTDFFFPTNLYLEQTPVDLIVDIQPINKPKLIINEPIVVIDIPLEKDDEETEEKLEEEQNEPNENENNNERLTVTFQNIEKLNKNIKITNKGRYKKRQSSMYISLPTTSRIVLGNSSIFNVTPPETSKTSKEKMSSKLKTLYVKELEEKFEPKENCYKDKIYDPNELKNLHRKEVKIAAKRRLPTIKKLSTELVKIVDVMNGIQSDDLLQDSRKRVSSMPSNINEQNDESKRKKHKHHTGRRKTKSVKEEQQKKLSE